MTDADPTVFLRVGKTTDAVEETTRMFDSKKWLWVPDDEEGFKSGSVKTQKGDRLTVELSDGQVSKLLLLNIANYRSCTQQNLLKL